MRRRLDSVLVDKGLVSSRTEAVRLISSGEVLVSGVVANKSSRLVHPSEPVLVTSERRWVGRGAEKLEHALSVFGLSVEGRHVLDAGASTGGFTECLLRYGAAGVIAVDVGRHQLHERLRSDPRVTSLEETDVRDVDSADLPYECSLVVADLSFISLTSVVGHLRTLVRPEAGHCEPHMALLVKPQFEAGRIEASRGRGVITDPQVQAAAVARVEAAVVGAGDCVRAVTTSPLKGAKGNVEFLMLVAVSQNP